MSPRQPSPTSARHSGRFIGNSRSSQRLPTLGQGSPEQAALIVHATHHRADRTGSPVLQKGSPNASSCRYLLQTPDPDTELQGCAVETAATRAALRCLANARRSSRASGPNLARYFCKGSVSGVNTSISEALYNNALWVAGVDCYS
jgi:hypothetical protein